MTGSVHISQHPVVATKLSQLREASQSSKATRGLVHDLATLLSYEASVDLALTHEKTLMSPYEPFQSSELKQRIALVPVLRSGLSLVDGFLAMFPEAPILHLGLYREKSKPGLAQLQKEHPEVQIYFAGVDENLDGNGFIRPGLGDIGDRLMNTAF
ncbi:hypothetical protein [Absidia glauca]|uniref:Phosphoribosyltransferase domain-containing protein n=1 Tax=Absidia glauca TaxID=4829 RepID=A0A163J7H0_ABSGL|nr:hypothetical protein [Absidia glauca]